MGQAALQTEQEEALRPQSMAEPPAQEDKRKAKTLAAIGAPETFGEWVDGGVLAQPWRAAQGTRPHARGQTTPERARQARQAKGSACERARELQLRRRGLLRVVRAGRVPTHNGQ